MSDDILNRIDEVIAGHRERFDPLGGDVWDEDRVDRWGDGMRVRPARTGIEEESEPGEAAVTWTTNHDPRSIGCRNCGSWLPQRVALCGPCGELPPCSAVWRTAIWGGAAVCFLPAGHSRDHESVEGSTWTDPVDQVEALRPFLTRALDAEAAALASRVRLAAEEIVARALADQPEPVSPLVDASSDVEVELRRYECHHSGCGWVRVALDLDVFDGLLADHERTAHAPRKSKLSELAAALRARARRGGPR